MTTRAAAFTRRAFLVGLATLIGFGRRIRAQVEDYTRYQPLARPAQVALDDLMTPARAFPFTADGMTLPSAAQPNQPVHFNGMVVRTSKGDNSADRFKAVCLKCPHEGCDVDFIADPGRIPSEVTDALGHLNEALYICPCHNSTFKMGDGSKLFGPAPRGLYRFKVTAVNETAVEIGAIEEDALLIA